MGVVAWAPLNGGWLTGKYRKGQPLPDGSRAQSSPDHFRVNAAKYDAAEALLAVAANAGMSLTHLAVAWVREHPAVTAAIIGPRTPDQLGDLLAGADVTLGADVLDAVDAIVAPGVNLSADDAGWTTWELEAQRRRRGAARP
jgi:aryl-alcohol dehydrogenase-like predicted oxidoreductase